MEGFKNGNMSTDIVCENCGRIGQESFACAGAIADEFEDIGVNGTQGMLSCTCCEECREKCRQSYLDEIKDQSTTQQ